MRSRGQSGPSTFAQAGAHTLRPRDDENPLPDTTPDSFAFDDVSEAALSTVYQSNTVVVSGINAPAAVTVAGGEWRKNGGVYGSSAGSVVNGDTVQVRGTSSASNTTVVNVVLTIGGVSDTFSITTEEAVEPVYDPMTALGSKLLAWWDADNAASLTLSDGAVTTWTDKKNGYAVTQATAANRPAYGSTSFNGAPGLNFDGTNDELTLASVPFPSGSAQSEVWVLAECTADPAVSGGRYSFSYGNATNNTRRAGRVVAGGLNRARNSVGNNSTEISATDGLVDLAARHVHRAKWTPTTASIAVDGQAATSVAAVPSTATSRTRIGAASSTTAGNFWQGKIAAIIVTDGTLTTQQEADLLAWLMSRAEGTVDLAEGQTTNLNGLVYSVDKPESFAGAVVRQPGGVMEFLVRQNQVWSNDAGNSPQRERAELRCETNYSYGIDLWGAFAQRIRDPGAALSATQMVVGQWHTDNTVSATNPIMAADLLNTGDWRIFTRGGPDNSATVPRNVLYTDAGFNYGQWYRHVFRLKLGWDGDGELEWWRDGVQIVSQIGIDIGYPGDDDPYWKFGIYRYTDTPDLRVDYQNMELGTASLLARVSSPLPLA